MNTKNLVVAGLFFVLGSTAQAEMLLVANSGFEDLYFGSNLPESFGGDVPPTAFPAGPAPAGWDAFGAVGGGASIGVLSPGTAISDNGTNFPLGAPEGDNVALLFFDQFDGGPEFGIEQTLSATLQANTVYTLSVGVGNIASGVSSVEPFQGFGFFDLRGFPGYRIDLLAGDTVIAQDDDTLSPGEGVFETSVIQAVVGDTHPQLGLNLTIRLVNLNEQDVNESVVDLEVDFDHVRLDAAAVPSPGSSVLVLVGIGVGCLLRPRALGV